MLDVLLASVVVELPAPAWPRDAPWAVNFAAMPVWVSSNCGLAGPLTDGEPVSGDSFALRSC